MLFRIREIRATTLTQERPQGDSAFEWAYSFFGLWPSLARVIEHVPLEVEIPRGPCGGQSYPPLFAVSWPPASRV